MSSWDTGEGKRDGDRIAALREEIRRAGRATRAMRLCSGAAAFIPLAALVLLAAGWCLIAPVEYYQRHMWHGIALALALGVIWVAMPLAVLIALALGMAFRYVNRTRLAGQIASLDSLSRAAVLLPLRAERLGDTRKIVAPLLREFGLPSEIIPATAPDAGGDEASPAEGTA